MDKPKLDDGAHGASATLTHTTSSPVEKPAQPDVAPFAGRLGGNQAFVLNRHHHGNRGALEKTPDAAPGMSFEDQFSLEPFKTVGLWKAALIEGMATLMFVYITILCNISPDVLSTPPTAQLGYFDNAAYFGPLTGGISNFLFLTLFIITFGTVTGAHFNPTITIATFFARLCTLPRLVLYVSFQTAGGALGGLLARASYNGRDFKTGGCYLFPDVASVGQAFTIEYVACTLFVFLAFGVGLDPQQQRVIPPSLSPFLVGMVLGVIGWSTGYPIYGYGGASLNPARCFGTFVGSHFPYWHYIHWVADIAACITHGVFHTFSQPGSKLFTLSPSGHPV